jgi:hypothetical protein
MYRLLIFLFMLASCQQTTTNTEQEQPIFNNRLESMKAELLAKYNLAPNDIAKKDLLSEYQKKLHSYLFDSCKLVLDSIAVEVDELSPVDDRSFVASFENPVAEFSSTITFKEDADLSKDSLYAFIKGLRENEDTTVRFFYLGSCTVNDPTSSIFKTFEIEAIPGSIKSQINMPEGRRP